MERIESAALSKIADLLSDSTKSPIIPKVDIWKKIFNNAEQGELFEDMQHKFKITIENIGWSEKNFYHNEKTYDGLLESFMILVENYEELLKLLNSAAHKFYWFRLFDADKVENVQKRYHQYKELDVVAFFDAMNTAERNSVFDECSLKAYKVLKTNLNLLGLEVAWLEEQFCILPLSERSMEVESVMDMISQWLSSNYSNVYNSFVDARKAYTNGDAVGCVTHCRNVITGITSAKKDDGREWYSGLQKICKDDKNIATQTAPKQIPSIKYNPHSTSINERYQYPRFNFINKLYVMTCDLGAHINEGNISSGVVDSEVTSMEDALWILRSMEDFLIWLVQSGNMN